MRILQSILSFFLVLNCSFGQLSWVSINIEKFGAVPNDSVDDSPAFIDVMNMVMAQPGNYKLIIPKGIYDVYKPIISRNLSGNIFFEGQEGVEIRVHGFTFAYFKASSREFSLAAPARRSDSTITIGNSSSNLQAGDLIHIQSNSEFERAWHYKEHDVHKLVSINNNELSLKEPLLFNYDPNKEKVQITVYKPCKIIMHKIKFLYKPQEDTSKPIRGTMCVIKGISADLRDIDLSYAGPMQFYHIGISIVASGALYFQHMSLSGFMYPVLMNYCRNIKAFNTEANYCRHAYTPAQACDQVNIENLRGIHCHSVMDAHVCFNVHYKDVLDTMASEFPNCRSLGTFIENARIYVDDEFYQDYCYWSVQNLTDEYRNLGAGFDTRFLKVDFVAKKPSAFNGLTSYTCRRLLVDSCITHSVAFYGDQKNLQQVKISNSTIGVIRIDGQKTIAENIILEGKLFPQTPYIFRFTGTGSTTLDHIVVKDYNPSLTYLFDNFYNQPSVNNLNIYYAQIGSLKGFTNKLQFPEIAYPNLTIRNSQISPFREKVQKNFTGFKKKDFD